MASMHARRIDVFGTFSVLLRANAYILEIVRMIPNSQWGKQHCSGIRMHILDHIFISQYILIPFCIPINYRIHSFTHSTGGYFLINFCLELKKNHDLLGKRIVVSNDLYIFFVCMLRIKCRSQQLISLYYEWKCSVPAIHCSFLCRNFMCASAYMAFNLYSEFSLSIDRSCCYSVSLLINHSHFTERDYILVNYLVNPLFHIHHEIIIISAREMYWK